MERRTFLQGSLLSAAAPIVAGCAPPLAPSPPLPQLQPTRTPLPPPLSGRKGIALGVGKAFSVDQLDRLDVDWFYTWGASRPRARTEAEFVPMIWGAGSVGQKSFEQIYSDLPLNRTQEILGFNEPDHPEQSDMSVSRAIQLWPRLQEFGLRLGSPAAVQPLGDWLKRFMTESHAKDLRVDFIAMHAYPGPDVEAFLDQVQQVHAFYGKPIWITEFAVADWDATRRRPSRHSGKEIRSFMEGTVQGMRDLPYVERFSWKSRPADDPIMGESAIFQKNGALTETGDLYRSL